MNGKALLGLSSMLYKMYVLGGVIDMHFGLFEIWEYPSYSRRNAQIFTY